MMGRLKLIVIVIGAVLIWFGIEEQRLSSVAKSDPQTMMMAELEANGPGDNAHIVLTDFLLMEESYVYTEKKGRWTEAWIPGAVLDGEYHQGILAMYDEEGNYIEGSVMPKPKEIRVLVKLPNARNADDVSKAANADTLQGMVVNQIESLGSDEQKILRETYPSIDFDSCWIFENGRSPSTWKEVAAQIGAGLAMVVVGLWGLISRRKRTPKPTAEVEADA